jgi:hypothetical protein
MYSYPCFISIHKIKGVYILENCPLGEEKKGEQEERGKKKEERKRENWEVKG